MMKKLRVAPLGAAALLVFLMAGCAAVGPDYSSPQPTIPGSWNTPLTDGLSSGTVSLETLAQWWTMLDDPKLTHLIGRVVDGNLDLKEARARVREARARRGMSAAERYPSVDATASARKSRSSENTGNGSESELYSSGFDAAWELDVFGGIRRSIEAADADLAASREDLNDVMVSLMAETALNYVDVRSYQARLVVAEANLEAQSETYQLARDRHEAGLTDGLSVEQARYNMESTRSGIPDLRTRLEAALNRLAVLVGEAPGGVYELLQEVKPIPVAPVAVAVGIPADVLRQRPDVRRSERELAAQTARIGEATAELYPKISLSGSIGLESVQAGDLLTGASRIFSIGPGITWNLFDTGSIRRNIDVQSALQEEALISYEATILSALEAAENAMTAYAQEQHRRESLKAAVLAAKEAVILARDRYRSGIDDFDSVLDAQRSLLSFEDNLAQSEGTVTANLIRIYKVLGGGWTSQGPLEIQLQEESNETNEG